VIETETALREFPSFGESPERNQNQCASITGPFPCVQFVSLLVKVKPKVIETETALWSFPRRNLLWKVKLRKSLEGFGIVKSTKMKPN